MNTMEENSQGVAVTTGARTRGPRFQESSHVDGASNVKSEPCVVDNDVDVPLDPEVLLLRHKRVTSGYGSDTVVNLSADDIGAEINRVKQRTDEIKRRLVVLSRNHDQSSCESVTSADDANLQQKSQYVTVRDGRHRGYSSSVLPSATSLFHKHASDSAPATSSDHRLRGRQPSAGRQPSMCTPTNSPVRQRIQTVRLPPATDQQPFIRRHLFDNVDECEANSGSDKVKVAYTKLLPVRVSDRKKSSVAEYCEANSLQSSKLKSDRKVKAHGRESNVDLCLRESKICDSVSESESDRSVKLCAHSYNQSVKYREPIESVSKCATSRAVSVTNDVKAKSKCNCRCANADSNSESSDDDSCSAIDKTKFSSRSVAKRDRSKRSKSVADSVFDNTKVKPIKKSVKGKATVFDKVRSAKPDCRHEGSVYSESVSESEDDDKSCVLRKRSAFIKPDKFDGVSPTFATFKAHFDNAAKFNHWNSDEQLAFLKSSLSGSAAQCLWDQSPECTDTLGKLWKLLSDRFAGQNLTEKYRTELRNRRRKQGESLDTLCQDIRRLLILGYPGPTSSAHEAIAKDSFIDALSSELSLKVRERDPSSLDAALHVALRLEAIHQTAATRDLSDDNGRAKGRARAVATGSNTSTDSAVLLKLNEMQAHFDSQLKTINGRMDNVESSVRRQQRSDELQRSATAGQRTGQKTWNSAPRVPAPTQQSHVSNQRQPATTLSFSNSQPTSSRTCYVCGDPTHLMRQCPNARNMVRSGDWKQPAYYNQHNPPSVPELDQTNAATTRGSHGQLDNGNVYLIVYVNGQRFLALLDSGCELSLAPSKLVDKRQLRPTTQRVYAANGSPIQVLGETDIEFTVGGQATYATVLVTPDVSELMLGITWLTERHGVWDFYNRTLSINGAVFPLHSRKTSVMCRRVYVEDNIVVAPRQQVDVPARSTVNNITVSESKDWMLETQQLRRGVLVARTLLPDTHRGIAVRVVNTTSEPQELRRDTCLGSLEAVDVCDEYVGCNLSDTSDTCHATSSQPEVDPVSEILQTVSEDLTSEQRETVTDLLRRYEDVFSKGEFDVGCTRLIEHHIDTGQHRPIRQALRRHPMAYLDAIDDYVQQLQQKDMIEPSAGPWCSNIVAVRRKDGRLRLCIDYRGVNAHTYYDSYPLPNIEATLDALGGSSWFCTLDLRSGYHNVTIAEEDRDKTQFITRRGTFRWKRMPFGLSTAPGTFQRLMDLVMCGLSYESVLIYLDDLIIMASSFEQLVERFTVVLERLRAANLKLNCRKCSLFQRKVSFLGHVVSAAGIEVQPEKTEVVSNWPQPNNLTEVRSFLGLASYYRRFIKGFSVIATPLNLLLRKGCQFHWGDEQQEAFDELKLRLTTAPVLSSPRSSGTYYLDTDAADSGLGVVLSQEQDGEERVLAYASRSLNAAERNYSITRKELLAVIFGLKRFRQYLIGRKFIIRTDHSALQWLRRTPEPIAQAGRWLATMEEFDFTVQHRSGAKHQNADALSRYPVRSAEEEISSSDSVSSDIGDIVTTRAVRRQIDEDPDYHIKQNTAQRQLANDGNLASKRVWHVHAPAELAELQRADPDIGPIIRLRLEHNEQPSFDLLRDQSTNTKIYWSQWTRLIVREGVVFRQMFDNRGRPDGLQLLVPICLRSEMIDFVHCGLTGSHVGIAKTMYQVLRRGWWRGWRADVRRQLKRCSRCSRYHRGALPRQGPLQPTRVGAVFERLSIDLTGPHVRSRRGYVYILTVVCPFSKFCECLPLRNKEATTVARVLVEEVFCRYGMPLALLSDRGGEVDGNIMKEVCRLLQIDKLRTSAYHPACNAACERMHRTLNSLLGKVVSERQVDWDEHLPFVAAALRASRSDATKYSANFLMFGREVNTPADIVYGLSAPEAEPPHDDFVEEVREKMTAAYDIVRENLGVAAERNKRYYDLKGKPASFKEGDHVYYFNPRRYCGRSDKWSRKYTGPFLVVKVLSPVTVLLRTLNCRREFVSHVDKLRMSYEHENPSDTHSSEHDKPAPVPDNKHSEIEPRPRRQIRPPHRLIAE